MAKSDSKKSTKPASGKPVDRMGAGQNRMSKKRDVSNSRFRKRYRELAPHELIYNDAIKDTGAKLEFLIDNLRSAPTRETSLAMTYLEIAVMFAVKELTGKPLSQRAEQINKLLDKASAITAN